MRGQQNCAFSSRLYLTRECSHCQRRYAVVRVTHTFHPLFARQLPCVGKRYNRHCERLLLQTEDSTVWSVPRNGLIL
ncbi:DUF5372 family protein [Sinorhizobium meliloti]|uniref:DUF5372 family protein n=1 Tax=Rhizobium meliloti TaxID=382 RepID=UPI003D9FE220